MSSTPETGRLLSPFCLLVYSLPCTLWGTYFPSFPTPLVSSRRLTNRALIFSNTDKISSLEHCQDGPALLFQNKSQAGNVSSNRGKVELFIAKHISISEALKDKTIPGFLSFSVFFKELGRLWIPELLNLWQRNLVYNVFKGSFDLSQLLLLFFRSILFCRSEKLTQLCEVYSCLSKYASSVFHG